jgi:hypothetical protein
MAKKMTGKSSSCGSTGKSSSKKMMMTSEKKMYNTPTKKK